ncbi:hypothetical protein FRB95_001284 [Tulasnella sp. JGI-2019a]|nr:hypothetical protein FRB95_001284 [Tulasnella sp. JGI-2019a]
MRVLSKSFILSHTTTHSNYHSKGRISINMTDHSLHQTCSVSCTSRRGRIACLRCRSRKTKCDAKMPCTDCVRSGEECIYEQRKRSARSEKALTEKLSSLQSRYNALAISESACNADIPQHHSDTALNSTVASTRQNISRAPIYSSESMAQNTLSEELRSQLLRIAMHHCSQDIDSSFISTVLTLPESQRQQPALLNAFMLLATWWGGSQLPPGTPSAGYFVQQIRMHLSTSLQAANGLLGHVAASMLLSWWFIQNGRFVEGQFEVSTNARLAIGCGLHQVDGDVINGINQGTCTRPLLAYGILGKPSSVADLQSRVNIFWSVYYMDRVTALVTGLPSAFDDFTSDPKMRITTVLPRLNGTYTEKWSFDDFASVDDLMLSSQLVTPPGPTSPPIFRNLSPPGTMVSATVQAVTLALRATKLASNPPQTANDAIKIRASLITLNTALARYTASIPTLVPLHHLRNHSPPFAYGATSAQAGFFRVAEVTAAAYVVIIKMHQAAEALNDFDPELRIDFGSTVSPTEKRLTAARAIAKIAKEVVTELDRPDSNSNPTECLCVLSAFFWTTAACVFVDHAAELRNALVPGVIIIDPRFQLIVDDFNKITFGLRRLARIFPAIELRLDELERMMEEASSV